MKLLLLLALLTAPLLPDHDIWNLPPLKIESGEYGEDWESLSRLYNVPQWWRDAKFGAWSHWDPQSAAEDGDWYSRGMYMPRNEQYKYHLEHYGHPSEYGYKDLCNDWQTDLWDPDQLMRLWFHTTHCRQKRTEKENGGKGWTPKTYMVPNIMMEETHSTLLLPISSCGAWTMPSGNTSLT